tara:strand:- start:191 stop:697 length:507 start_codon:yes stop_codon:yes gene_type:complete
MNTEQLVKLFPKIETQVCGILIENGICEYINLPKSTARKTTHNTLVNLRVLGKYKELSGYAEIDNKFVQSIRGLYPKGSSRKGSVNTIKMKMTAWLDNNQQYSKEDVFAVIESYVLASVYRDGGEMLFGLDNIFYKQEGRFTKIPMDGLFEKYYADASKEQTDEVDEY